MKAFKAYDIRGIYGEDITCDLAYQVGRCLPTLLNTQNILVGRDMRLSSEDLTRALIKGICEAGANAWNLGLATTPMVYFFTAEGFNNITFGGSVMVTASHNPKEYNGLKVSKAGARPCGYHLGLSDIEAQIETGHLPPKQPAGTAHDLSLCEAYIAWLKAHTPPFDNLRFAVDCSDGAAGILARALFGPHARYLNETPNGAFPHHGPNPLEPANRETLRQTVLENNLDFGILFDGDADRVAFIDNLGNFVPPDAMIPLFARRLGKPGEVVVHDVRTSRGVIETLREDGFSPLMVKVGAAFAKTALREHGGICGGEVAGHYYFRNFHWCDSGEFAACQALGILAEAKQHGQTLADLLAPITSRYYASGEVNLHHIGDRPAAIQAVEAALLKQWGAPTHRIDFDGVRLDWPNAWFGVRASNTEPILRLAGEAKTREHLAEMLAIASRAGNAFRSE